MISSESTEARKAILHSIRKHLAASLRHDAIRGEIRPADEYLFAQEKSSAAGTQKDQSRPLIDLFKENLEAVDGQCLIASGEIAVVQALREIIKSLRNTPGEGMRVALSDAPALLRLTKELEQEVEEIAVSPTASRLFDCDVGITRVQAAIAETGTLVLQSDCERHRLVSLLPPIHIAIIEAGQLCLTLGEALAVLRRNGDKISPTITFITGPSRTADIELTLAIGVHGPQKLFVIVNSGPQL